MGEPGDCLIILSSRLSRPMLQAPSLCQVRPGQVTLLDYVLLVLLNLVKAMLTYTEKKKKSNLTSLRGTHLQVQNKFSKQHSAFHWFSIRFSAQFAYLSEVLHSCATKYVHSSIGGGDFFPLVRGHVL